MVERLIRENHTLLNLAEVSLIWNEAIRLHPLDAGVDNFADTLDKVRSIYLEFREGDGL